jgi:MFS family permease
MKKATEFIKGFAGVFFFTQIFSYFSANGNVWNTPSFFYHLVVYIVAVIAFLILALLIAYFKKPSSTPEEPTVDERTKGIYLRFIGSIFMFSYFILMGVTGYLMLTNQETIPTNYLFYYSFGVLFIGMVVSPMVIRKL